MTSTMTYLLDALLGRSAVKLTGKAAPVSIKDPCEFCPNSHQPSETVAIDANVDMVFLCLNCAELIKNRDLAGMTEKIRLYITDGDKPAPWWLWEKERHRRELSIRVTAMDIAHSYFKSVFPELTDQEGQTT